nr:ATP-grasp peptide maturase system methyltransferase [Streptomyces avicenniae]
MSTSPADESEATRLRQRLAEALVEAGVVGDERWGDAVRAVPRHRFTPGFYLPSGAADEHGLPVWEPVTAALDRPRWLTAAYSDISLITQFDGEEPDWAAPRARHGGAPTSSSTLPSLVLRMWRDAEVTEEHDILEIGTGSGYSTALVGERLGSTRLTSIDVDDHRLAVAADALHDCGYTPTLAVADGRHGYWPESPFDRIVAACSFRTVPPALVAQTRPGGKILVTLGGWLHGYARVLLTVATDGTAAGPLLPGTVSFMSARTDAPPPFGNPAHWAAEVPAARRDARHSPARITDATEEAFFLRFLAQSSVPTAQLTATGDDALHLIDVATGSAAVLTRGEGAWRVGEKGPVRLWERVEETLDAYDAAGRPGQQEFGLHVNGRTQYVSHPRMPDLRLGV